MADETEGTQDRRPLVGELLKPSPSLPFDLIRRNEDGSETRTPFRCRLLRYELQNEALIAARKLTAEKLKLDKSDTAAIESSAVFREAQAFEIAWRSCLHPERRKQKDGAEIDLPLFATPAQMRMALDVVEVAQLLNAVTVTTAYYSFTDLNEDKVDALIDVLADELQGGYFLSQLASEEWPHLIYILARLARSWRPATDPTQSDSDSSSESDQPNSGSGTTGSSKLPDAHVTGSPLSGLQLPTTGQATKDEARQMVIDHLNEAKKD